MTHHLTVARAHPGLQSRGGKVQGGSLAVALALLGTVAWRRLGRGGLRDWLRRNAIWLIAIGLVALAIAIAAVLGASVLWAALAGVFVGVAYLVVALVLIAKGMRRRP